MAKVDERVRQIALLQTLFSTHLAYAADFIHLSGILSVPSAGEDPPFQLPKISFIDGLWFVLGNISAVTNVTSTCSVDRRLCGCSESVVELALGVFHKL